MALLELIKDIFTDRKSPVGALYIKRSKNQGIPDLSEAEFYANLDLDLPVFQSLQEAVKSRDYNRADEILLKYFRGRKKPVFFFSPDDKDFIINSIRNFPELVEKIIQKAELSSRHIFDILGSRFNLGNPVNWFSDFKGNTWAYGYFDELNNKLYDNDFSNQFYIGDIKLPWELNKHLHFIDLAAAYYLTGEEKYASELIAQIKHWIQANPVNMGINWTQNLIVSQRLISWTLTLFLILDSSVLDPHLFRLILKEMLLHAAYIPPHFETAEKGSNHLIGNLSALLTFSLAFPEFKESAQWKKISLGMLTDELSKQVYDDGVQYEQSAGYHRYVLEFCLLPLMIMQLNNEEAPPVYRQKVEKMAEFTLYMQQPNGFVQPASDADGARVWNLNNADFNDHRSCLAIASVLFNRGDFRFSAGKKVEELLWFFGRKGFEKFISIKDKTPELAKAFPQGGYFISRDGWKEDSSWLFFDCGPVGMGDWNDEDDVGTHGHSDILNFDLVIEGETFFTDLGSFTYTGSKEWHDYFRSSKAHNLALVDGEDQSVLTRTWSMKMRAKPQDAKWNFTENFDYFSGAHNGYRRLEDPVIVRREILFPREKKLMLIKDSLEGRATHLVEIFFHLYPGIEAIKHGDGSILLRAKTRQAQMKVYTPKELYLNTCEGSKNPISGWYSPDYGQKVPSVSIEFKTKLEFPAVIYTWIGWEGSEVPTLKQVEELWQSYLK